MSDEPITPEPETPETEEPAADLLDEIRAAEAAHQASICIDPSDAPKGQKQKCEKALASALDLRVEANLAQHDDGPVRRVGHTDPRVRKLEAPWTRKARRAAGSTR